MEKIKKSSKPETEKEFEKLSGGGQKTQKIHQTKKKIVKAQQKKNQKNKKKVTWNKF